MLMRKPNINNNNNTVSSFDHIHRFGISLTVLYLVRTRDKLFIYMYVVLGNDIADPSFVFCGDGCLYIMSQGFPTTPRFVRIKIQG